MKNSDKNDVTTEASQTIEEPTTEQLEILKGVATSLGIKYSSRIGLQALSDKIREYAPPVQAIPQVQILQAPAPDVVDITAAEKIEFNKMRAKLVKEATRLERVIVTCMNPEKTKHPGAIFTVSNSIVPTLKKYVPFSNAEGWHVPHMIVNMIRECKCQIFKEVEDRKGKKYNKSFIIPEYSVVTLPPLTKAEMAELAEKQTLARNID